MLKSCLAEKILVALETEFALRTGQLDRVPGLMTGEAFLLLVRWVPPEVGRSRRCKFDMDNFPCGQRAPVFIIANSRGLIAGAAARNRHTIEKLRQPLLLRL